MSRRHLMLTCTAALMLASSVAAQPILGTYSTLNPQGGTITLDLRALGGGRVDRGALRVDSA